MRNPKHRGTVSFEHESGYALHLRAHYNSQYSPSNDMSFHERWVIKRSIEFDQNSNLMMYVKYKLLCATIIGGAQSLAIMKYTPYLTRRKCRFPVKYEDVELGYTTSLAKIKIKLFKENRYSPTYLNKTTYQIKSKIRSLWVQNNATRLNLGH